MAVLPNVLETMSCADMRSALGPRPLPKLVSGSVTVNRAASPGTCPSSSRKRTLARNVTSPKSDTLPKSGSSRTPTRPTHSRSSTRVPAGAVAASSVSRGRVWARASVGTDASSIKAMTRSMRGHVSGARPRTATRYNRCVAPARPVQLLPRAPPARPHPPHHHHPAHRDRLVRPHLLLPALQRHGRAPPPGRALDGPLAALRPPP